MTWTPCSVRSNTATAAIPSPTATITPGNPDHSAQIGHDRLLLQRLVPLVLLRRSGVGPADEAVTREPRNSGLTKPNVMGAA
jgi:hypothetical protein